MAWHEWWAFLVFNFELLALASSWVNISSKVETFRHGTNSYQDRKKKQR